MAYWVITIFVGFLLMLGETDFSHSIHRDHLYHAEQRAEQVMRAIDEIYQWQYAHPGQPLSAMPEIDKYKLQGISLLSEYNSLYLWVANNDSLYTSLLNASGNSMVLGEVQHGKIINCQGDVIDSHTPATLPESSLVFIFRNISI